MNRRHFIRLIALIGPVLAAGKALAAKIARGRCGAVCANCEQQKTGACDGCGTGEKAQCTVFKCNSRKGLDTCASCRACPCARHQRINPPASARA